MNHRITTSGAAILAGIVICTCFCRSASAADLEKWQQRMHDAAVSWFVDGNFDQAIAIYKGLQKESEGLPNAARVSTDSSMAHVYEMTGRYAEAESLYRQLITQTDGVDEYAALAGLLEKEKKFDEAKEIIRKRLSEDESAPRKQFDKWFYGQIYGKLGALRMPSHPGAELVTVNAWCNAIIRILPGSPKIVAFIGDSSGDEDAAAKTLKAIDQIIVPSKLSAARMKLYPVTFGNWTDWGPWTQDRYKKLRNQLEYQEKLLGTNHPEIACTLRGIAEYAYSSGNSDVALKACDHAMQIWDSNGIQGVELLRLLNYAAGIYYEKKMYPESTKLTQRAIPIAEAIYGGDSTFANAPKKFLAKIRTKTKS